jgi:radical SAM superfamily enzyme YgiQ (UPF0313 family)
VDEELLALLKRSGCWQVNFGIESGDAELLENTGRIMISTRWAQTLMVKAGMRVRDCS